MARVWQLLVKARGDSHHAKKSISELKKASRNLNRAIGVDFGNIARNGALALGAGLALSVRTGVNELRESKKVAAQVSSAWAANGKNAGITRGEIDRLSTSLAYKAAIDDELVATAQAQTLAFRNVRNEAGKGNSIFTRLTQVSADYSARTGKDLVQSQVKFAKALNQPEKAAKLLRTAGVALTTQQEQQVKSLTKSGDVLGAQKIILGELEKRYRGAAAAAGDASPWERLKETFANLTATIIGGTGRGFGDLVNRLSEAMLKLDLFLQSAKGAKVLDQVRAQAANLGKQLVAAGRVAVAMGKTLYQWRSVLIPVAAGIGAVMAALRVYKIVTAAAWAFRALAVAMYANPVGAIALGLIAIGAALVVAYKRSATFRGIVQRVAGVMRALWEKLMDNKKALLILMGPIGLAIAAFLQLRKHSDTLKKKITGLFTGAVNAAQNLPGQIVAAISGLASSLMRHGRDAGTKFGNAIKDAINAVLRKIKNLALPTIKIAGKTIPGSGTKPFAGLPTFARGGIATRPSIFGEAGPEAAVPLGSSLRSRRDRERVLADAGLTGGTTVQMHIHPAPGMSEELIARKVIRRLRTTGMTT